MKNTWKTLLLLLLCFTLIGCSNDTTDSDNTEDKELTYLDIKRTLLDAGVLMEIISESGELIHLRFDGEVKVTDFTDIYIAVNDDTSVQFISFLRTSEDIHGKIYLSDEEMTRTNTQIDTEVLAIAEDFLDQIGLTLEHIKAFAPEFYIEEKEGTS